MGLGIFLSIIIGGIAGFIAEKIMKAEMGLVANILLGIVGANVLNFLLRFLDIFTKPTILVQGVVAVAGACMLIWLYRAFKSR